MVTRVKAGVQLEEVTAMILLHCVVSEVMREHSVDTVITSGTDGVHKSGSLHYFGHAIDYRTRNIPVAIRPEVRDEIKRRLGAEFDVVLEVDHLHVEWDPKEPEVIV